MKTYSSIMLELNEELLSPEIQILIHEDPCLLSALHTLQEFLRQKAHHDSSSPWQETLCWGMVCSLRKKKQAIQEKTQHVTTTINQLPENVLPPIVKEYMRAIALVSPGDAEILLQLIA